MYNKQEASAARQKFWTRYGQYMAPVPSASGKKVNWVNYKTGIKGIAFRTDADNNRAYTAVEISLPDKMLQHQYFDIFCSFSASFEKAAGPGWDMHRSFVTEDGKEISRISVEINGINIFRESDWTQIIPFLKERIRGLDAFWNDYKPAFEMVI
ncbi:MAG: DUF4268 domain-containing protein [Ferruginibacter sp.]